MIITCPKCKTSFTLPANVLAAEGSEVRCSECGETWHQLPDPDELLEEIENSEDLDTSEIEDALAALSEAEDETGDDTEEDGVSEGDETAGEEDFRGAPQESQDMDKPYNTGENPDGGPDIPDGVKPRPDDFESMLRTSSSSDEAGENNAPSMAIRVSVIACIIVVLLMPLLLLRPVLISTWPKTVGFYATFGMADDFKAENLVFDKVIGRVEHDKFIVSGNIINLNAHKERIPTIEVILQDALGENIVHYYMDDVPKTLDAETTLPFTSEYTIDTHYHSVENVIVRFVLKAEKQQESHAVEEDDAVHEDDHDAGHASDHISDKTSSGHH